jgi:hypothetical protein
MLQKIFGDLEETILRRPNQSALRGPINHNRGWEGRPRCAVDSLISPTRTYQSIEVGKGLTPLYHNPHQSALRGPINHNRGLEGGLTPLCSPGLSHQLTKNNPQPSAFDL